MNKIIKNIIKSIWITVNIYIFLICYVIALSIVNLLVVIEHAGIAVLSGLLFILILYIINFTANNIYITLKNIFGEKKCQKKK